MARILIDTSNRSDVQQYDQSFEEVEKAIAKGGHIRLTQQGNPVLVAASKAIIVYPDRAPETAPVPEVAAVTEGTDGVGPQ